MFTDSEIAVNYSCNESEFKGIKGYLVHVRMCVNTPYYHAVSPGLGKAPG